MEAEPRYPPLILADLRTLSQIIASIRKRYASGEAKGIGDALSLQRAKQERERLRRELPPLTVVVDNTGLTSRGD